MYNQNKTLLNRLAALSVLLLGLLLVPQLWAGAAASGNGTMSVSPINIAPATSSTLTFTWGNGGKNWTAGAAVTVDVPTGWAAPQTNSSGTDGYVALTSQTPAGTIGAISVSGQTVTIPFLGANTAFTLTYKGTPPANDFYTFTTKSKISGGTLTAITKQPVVSVVTLKTRLSGAVNWSSNSTWIEVLSGTIACNKATTVTGTGTKFLTQLKVGDTLVQDANQATAVGVISSIASDTSLTLTGNSLLNTAAGTGFGRQRIPVSTDIVSIGNPLIAVGLTITLDTNATVAGLNIQGSTVTNVLTHASTNSLTVTGDMTVEQPTASSITNSWNINAGSATISGELDFTGDTSTNSRVARIALTTGTLNANGNIRFAGLGTNAAARVLDMSGGAATLNLKGALIFDAPGTLTPGTTSTFTYADTLDQSVLPFSSGNYNHLAISGGGIKALGTNVTVGGNLNVNGATLDLTSFTANRATSGGTLTVANGASLLIGGTGTLPANYASHSIGATSTIHFNGSSQTVPVLNSAQDYGNLTVSVSGTATLAGAQNVRGTLTLDTGTLAGATNLTLTSGSSIVRGSGSLASGTPTFAGTVDLTYTNGGVATGAELPTSAGNVLQNLTFTHSSGTVTLANSPTVNGTLTLAGGLLAVTTNTLTLKGPAIAGTPESLVTTSGSSLSFGGNASGISLPSGVAALNNLTINNTNGVNLNGSPTLSGTLTLTAGALTVGTHTLTLNGPSIVVTSGSLATTSASSLSFGGNSASVGLPASVTALNNLTVNNANGLVLNSSPTINGTLALSTGKVSTFNFQVNLSAGAAWTRNTGWVNGTLQKAFNTGSQSYTFPIGGSQFYRPVVLDSLNVTTPGTLSAVCTALAGPHPELGTSGLNTSHYVSRYWTLTAGNGLLVSGYNPTFTFDPSDVSSGAATSRFVIRKYSGGTWSATTTGTRAATTTSATGLSSFSDFVIGEPLATRMITTLPGQSFVDGTGNTGSVINQTAGQAFSIGLNAVDIFNTLDTTYNGTMTISYTGPANSPSGAAPVYTTSVPFTAGQAANVATILKNAETTTLTANNGLLTGVASASLTIAPSNSTQLVFTSAEQTVTAGSPSSAITVQRQDAFGNPNTTEASRTVTLSSTSTGTVTFNPASLTISSPASDASFTYTDTKAPAGPTITAASTSPSTITSASQKVTVNLGQVSDSASTLAASSSSVTADGTATSTITVTLKDAAGNPISGKSVSLLKTSGPGSPVITTGLNVTDSNGTGYWTVSSTTAGTVVFTALDTTDNTTVTQTASVTFTAGAMHHFSVTFSGAPYYALIPFTTYATAQDAFNNPVTDLAPTVVTFTSTSENIKWNGSANGAYDRVGSEIQTTTVNGVATILTKADTTVPETGVTISVSGGSYSGKSAAIDIDIATGAFRSKTNGNWSSYGTVWETWNGASWVSATNAPAATDGVITVLPTHTVTVDANLTVDQVHIESDGTVIVPDGVTLTVANSATPGFEVYGLLENNGTITVTSGGTLVVYDSGTLRNANTVNCSGSYGDLTFMGGSYQHNFTETAGTIPTATWRQNSQNSTCQIIGYTSNTGTPGGLGQNFQNFIWNCPSQENNISLGASQFTSVDNFNVTSTGSGALSLGASLAMTNALTVGTGAALYCGPYVVSQAAGSSASSFNLEAGGTLGVGSTAGIVAAADASPSRGNIQTSSRHFSSGANYVYNGTDTPQATGSGLPSTVLTLSVANTATSGQVNLNGDLAISQDLTLSQGALAIGAHTLTLHRNVHNSGGTLKGGITSSLVCTEYVALFKGLDYMPGVDGGLLNFTVDRADGINLGGELTVYGTLTLANGLLVHEFLSGETYLSYLTLADGAAIFRVLGSLDDFAAPNFAGNVDVTYTAGDLTTGVELPVNPNKLRNLAVTPASGTVTLSTNVTANSTVTIGSGATLSAATWTLTARGDVANSGSFSGTGRLLLAGGSAQHQLSGTGSYYVNLELNDTYGARLNSAATLTGTLYLTLGTLSSSGNLTLASGATISRAAGALDAAPTFSAWVDLVYTGSSGVTSGYEWPADTAVLNNLTLSYSSPGYTLTLDNPHTVNGKLTIGAYSTLSDAGYRLTVIGAITNSGTHTGSGSGEIYLDNPSSQTLAGNGAYRNLRLHQGQADLAGNPTINGTLTLPTSPMSGSFVVNSHTLTLNGPSVAGDATNLLTSAQSGLVFGGSSAGVKVPASVSTLGSLTINNPNSVTLSYNLDIVSTLALTSGKLNAGNYLVNLQNTDNASLTRDNGWVFGRLQKAFATGANQAFTFWIGDGSACRQISFSEMNVANAGSVRFEFIGDSHPQLATSGLNASKTLPFYWQRTAVGNLAISNLKVTDYFTPADVPAGASPSQFVVRGWNGSQWSNQSVAARTSTNITVTAQLLPSSGGANAIVSFTAGEPQASRILVTLPGQTFTPTIGNSEPPDHQVAGTPFNLTLWAVDSFNVVDTNFSVNQVSISYSGPSDSPNGAQPEYTTTVSGYPGYASGLVTKLKKAEITTITASGGGLTGVASSSLTVTAAATDAGSSTVSANPATVLADGLQISEISITLKDAYGNPVPDRTVTLASSRGATDTISTESGTSTASGVVTFKVKSTTAGAATFTATDTTGSIVLTQTAQVTFTPGTVHHFAIAPATIPTAQVNQPTLVTITAQDVNNNRVTSFNGAVTYGGTAGVTGNSGQFAAGQLADAEITPKVAGNNLTFTVTDASSHTGSATFTVINSSTVDHLDVYLIRPVYAGASFITVVTAKDAGNNTVTNFSGLLAMSSTGASATFGTPSAWLEGVASVTTTFANTATNVSVTATVSPVTGTSEPFNVLSLTGAYRTAQSGDWSDAATWQTHSGSGWGGATSPPDGSQSILIRPNHTVTVTNSDSTATVTSCHLDGVLVIDPGAKFTVAAGNSPSLEIHNELINLGTLEIVSAAVLDVLGIGSIYTNEFNEVVPPGTAEAGAWPVAGRLRNAGTITKTGVLNFLAHSTYQHDFTVSAGAIPLADRWDLGSTCEIIGYTSNTGTPGGLDQNFQNFIWNCPLQQHNITLASEGNIFSRADNFTVSSTGAGSIAVVLGADLYVTNATTVAAGAAIYCGDYKLSGGSFTLQSGALLGIGSPQGIAPAHAAGTGTITTSEILNSGSGTLSTATAGSGTLTIATAGTGAITGDGSNMLTGEIGTFSYLQVGASLYASNGDLIGTVTNIAASGDSANLAETVGSASFTNWSYTGASAAAPTNTIVIGAGTFFDSSLVGRSLFRDDGTLIGVVESVENAQHLTLADAAAAVATGSAWRSTGRSITGVSSAFASTLAPGNKLYKNDGTTFIGTVASIASATALTLTANAAVAEVSGLEWKYTKVSVSGSGTSFTSQLAVGMCIANSSGARVGIIDAITSDTALTLGENTTLAVNNGSFQYSDFSGNIATTNRNFSQGGFYRYNGTASQVTGLGLPSRVGRLIVDNSTGVALSDDLTVAYLLDLESGPLSLGPHTLTLEEDLARNAGSLRGGSDSTLVIDDSGGAAALALPGITDGLKDLTLDRALGADVSGPITIVENLNILEGSLRCGSHLTFGAGMTIVCAHGLLGADTEPTLLGMVNLKFLEGGITAGVGLPVGAFVNSINNMELANPSGTVLQPFPITLHGNLTIGAGATAANGGYTLTVNGNVENHGVSSGTGRILLTGGTAGQHTLLGDGTYSNLELNDTNNASITGAPSLNGTLYLTTGELNNDTGGSLTLANGATINRKTGTLGTRPTISSGAINVTYTGTTGVTAANELPTSSTDLNNLTLSYSGAQTLTLDAAHMVNGDLTIGDGNTLADGGYKLTVVNDVYNSGTHTGTGEICLDNTFSQSLYGNGSYANLHVEMGDVYLAGSPTIQGQLTLATDLFYVGTNTLTLNGPSIAGTPASLQTTLSSSLVFGGSSPNVAIPGSVVNLKGLAIANSAGVSLDHNLTLIGSLTLTSGTLNLASSKILYLNNPANNVVDLPGPTPGWVNGILSKNFASGNGQTFTFPIGDATHARPVSWDILDVTSPGQIDMQVYGSAHPELASSGLSSTNSPSVYWRGVAKGTLQLGMGTTATLTFGADLVPEGVNPNHYVVRMWDGSYSQWVPMTTTTRTATSTTAAGLGTTVAISPDGSHYEFADFVVGQPLGSQLLVTLPGETFTEGEGNSGTVSAQTAGTAFNLELRAVDIYNEVDQSFTGSKTISYSGPGTSPSGAAPTYTTSVTFTDGQATGVTTTLTKAETTNITASAASIPLTGLASSSLVVGAGAHNAYRLTAGVTTLGPGDGQPIAIRAADSSGNPVLTNKSVSLTFSGVATSGDGTHPATVTDTTGTERNLGQATSISLVDGTNSAGGLVRAYKAQTSILQVTDGIFSTASAGGAGVALTITNVTPVAGSYAISRDAGADLKIPKSALTALATDANYDLLSVASVPSTSAGGATVSTNSLYILYKHLDALGDTINYSIIDSAGGSSATNLTITVNGSPLPVQVSSAKGVAIVNGTVTVTFNGVRGVPYDVQRNSAPSSEGWSTLTPAPLYPGPDGTFTFTDNEPLQSSGYYRSKKH